MLRGVSKPGLGPSQWHMMSSSHYDSPQLQTIANGHLPPFLMGRGRLGDHKEAELSRIQGLNLV